MPCLSMSYPCHKFVRLSAGFRPSNEIQQEIALLFKFCIPQHSVHQAQQDLFATAAPADSSFAPALTPPARAPARRRTPPARG